MKTNNKLFSWKKTRNIFTVLAVTLFTAMSYAQCNYGLKMLDSFGDGWNGNTIDILVNGEVVLDNVGLAGGSEGLLLISVNTGDEITTLWNGGGSYAFETSYKILDATGSEVGDGSSTSIDTAIVASCPSCGAPTDVVVSNVGLSTATVTWSAPANAVAGYEYYLTTDAVAPDENSTATASLTALTIDLTGLNSSTTYYMYVRSTCSANEVSPWTYDTQFITLCDSISDSEICESFENTEVGDTPACWSFINEGTGAIEVAEGSTFSPSPDGEKELKLGAGVVSDSGNIVMAISPEYNLLSDGLHQIKMQLKVFSGNSAEYGTMSDPEDASTFTSLGNQVGDSSWTEVIVEIPSGSDKYFVIKNNVELNFSSIYVDNICLELKPTEPPLCAEDLQVVPNQECGNLGYTLSWDASEDQILGYKLSIGTTVGGNDVLDNVQLQPTQTSYTRNVSNLETTYYFTLIPYNSVGDATGCTEISTTTGETGCYCDSEPTSNDNDGISNTKINDIDFVGEDVMYQDQTATPVNVAQGASVPVEITFATAYSYDTHIWVDWNDDYVFDASEKMYTGESLGVNPTTLVASFDVPADAVLGQHRLRIGTADSGQETPNPCYSGSWGVTVDATLNVMTQLSTQEFGMAKNNINVYPNPVKDILRIQNVENVTNITVVDMIGKNIISSKVQTAINVSNLNDGVYLVNLSYKDGSVKSIKFIKN